MSDTTDDLYLCTRIRNLLRRFDPVDVAVHVSGRLRTIEADPASWRQANPFHLLLIIRWALEYGERQFPPNTFGNNEFRKVYNLCCDLKGGAYMLDHQPGSVGRFMRTAAFQQFWFQSELKRMDLARQSILFGRLDGNHRIRVCFEQSVGLDIGEFLEVSFCVYAWLAQQKRGLLTPEGYFPESTFPADTIFRYFDAVARTPVQARDYLHNSTKVRNLQYQSVEKFPLIRYPFLRLSTGYLPYSARVFHEFVRNFVYDVIKENGDTNLSSQFGELLERYVARCLTEGQIPYIDEREIQRRFGDGKAPDFLLTGTESLVFVEAKSTQLAPLARVLPTTEHMVQELKGSVVKAVVQACEAIVRIKSPISQLSVDASGLARKDAFLLVVTYTELNLGTGVSAWQEFLRDAVEQRLPPDAAGAIEPNRMLFMALPDFENLVSAAASKVITLDGFLRRAAEANATPCEGKYYVSMHLTEDEQCRCQPLKLLQTEFGRLMDALDSRFP